LSDISGNANCFTRNAGEFVEFDDSLVNALLSFSLPRRDDDLLCTSEQECCRRVKTKSS